MKTTVSLAGALVCLLGCQAQSPPGGGYFELLGLEAYIFTSRETETMQAELGRLEVPENRSDPDSSHIILAFMRLPGIGPNPGPPIFFLEGGPGGAAIKSSRFPLYQALSALGDVIALDQRGTGKSEPALGCPERLIYPSDRPLDRALALQLYREKARGCAAYWRRQGVDLDGYNTNESADDIDAVRRALGLEKIRLVSMSYGSHLALATIRRHEAHIERAVLAGVEGLDHTMKLPGTTQRYLEKTSELVAADPEASATIPDFMGLIEKAVSDLEIDPARATISDEHGDEVEMFVSAFDLKQLVAGLVGRRNFIATIPRDFAPLQQRDYSSFAAFLGYPNSRRLNAMSAAMDCSSGVSPARWARIQKEDRQTLLGAISDFPYPEGCDAWGVADLGDAFREPLHSPVPTLFISGGLDGRTPPENAEEVRSGFPNSGHVIVEWMGHDTTGLFLSSPQVMEVVAEFFTAGKPISVRLAAPALEFSTPSAAR